MKGRVTRQLWFNSPTSVRTDRKAYATAIKNLTPEDVATAFESGNLHPDDRCVSTLYRLCDPKARAVITKYTGTVFASFP